MAIKETVFFLLLIMLPVSTEAKKPIKPRVRAASFYDAPSDSCTDNCVVKCCPSGWVRHGNSCYYIDDTPTPLYRDARNTCQSKGGDLAIIRSAQENDFILDLVMGQNTVTRFGAWIGFQRNAADSKLYWVDGTPVDSQYVNWLPGEPNDSYGYEDCGQMITKEYTPGKGNDLFCNFNVQGSSFESSDSPVVLCQKPI